MNSEVWREKFWKWTQPRAIDKGDREAGWEIRMQEHFLVKEQSKSQELQQLDQLDQYSWMEIKVKKRKWDLVIQEISR